MHEDMLNPQEYKLAQTILYYISCYRFVVYFSPTYIHKDATNRTAGGYKPSAAVGRICLLCE